MMTMRSVWLVGASLALVVGCDGLRPSEQSGDREREASPRARLEHPRPTPAAPAVAAGEQPAVGGGEPRGQVPGEHEVVVPVVREEVDVETRPVETGKVRVSKRVETREQLFNVPRIEEHVEVERVPVDRMLDQPVHSRREGDTLIVPVLEEVPVVQKRYRLKEEVRIRTRRVETDVPRRVTIKEEKAVVERVPGGEAAEVGSDRGPAPDAEPAGQPR